MNRLGRPKGALNKNPLCPKGHNRHIVGLTRSGGCVQCHKDWISTKGRWAEKGILNKDGTLFTTIDFDREYQIQQGKCRGCGKHSTELNKPLYVDHDHETMLFRTLLCLKCNCILGYATDEIKILENLIDILKGSK